MTAGIERGSFGYNHLSPDAHSTRAPSVRHGLRSRSACLDMNSHGSPHEQLGANGDNDDGDSALRTSNKRRRIAIACRTRKSRVR
jgi:hypothetical protein